nr:VanZ family protein [Flavobacterium taihuense]
MFLVALLWTVIVAYFCLIKSSDIPVINIPNLDKCIHVFFHFVFTFVWFLFFRKQIQTDNFQNPLLYSFILSFVFGITIEILQELVTTTRSADIFDVLANLTGALVTVFTVFICNKLNILNSIFKD